MQVILYWYSASVLNQAIVTICTKVNAIGGGAFHMLG